MQITYIHVRSPENLFFLLPRGAESLATWVCPYQESCVFTIFCAWSDWINQIFRNGNTSRSNLHFSYRRIFRVNGPTSRLSGFRRWNDPSPISLSFDNFIIFTCRALVRNPPRWYCANAMWVLSTGQCADNFAWLYLRYCEAPKVCVWQKKLIWNST